MSGYSENPGHVRIDFFKPESGKWYMTEMLDMSMEYNAPTVFAAVRNALSNTRHGRFAEKRWLLIVLEPYHVNGYPVSLSPGEASYEDWPSSTDQSKMLLGIDDPDGLYHMRDWAEMYHITVQDPDGWRSEEVDLATKLDQGDFLRLASASTITGEGVGPFADELRAWAARK